MTAQSQEICFDLDQLEKMMLSILEVSTRAKQITETTDNADQTVAKNRELIELTAQSISKLQSTAIAVAIQVKEINESTQKISHLIPSLTQITMQSNVKKIHQLARKSKVATQEIKKVILKINQETSTVVQTLEESTTQILQGSSLLESSQQQLNQIGTVLQQINSFTQSNPETSASQNQISEAITSLIQKVDQISQRTNESSRQLSATLEKTTLLFEKLQVGWVESRNPTHRLEHIDTNF